MSDQLDMFGGPPLSAKGLRDEALSRVARNSDEWMALALQQIKSLRSQMKTFTGEDLRLRLETRIGKPHHHNAMGALVKQALKLGLIERTGWFRAMTEPKSHARMTAVYRAASGV